MLSFAVTSWGVGNAFSNMEGVEAFKPPCIVKRGNLRTLETQGGATPLHSCPRLGQGVKEG